MGATDGKEVGGASWWPSIILGLAGLLTFAVGIGFFVLLAAVVTSPPVHRRLVARAARRGKTYGRNQAVLVSLALIIGLPLLLALAALLLVSLVGPSSAPPSKKVSSGSQQITPAKPAPAVAPPPKVRTEWRYSTSDDPMGGTEQSACVKSEDDIKQDFPYRDTAVLLCVRKSTRDSLSVSAMLIQGGQILCTPSIRCNINIRFDGKTAEPWPGLEAGDMSRDVVFLDRADRFVSAMKVSKELRLELEIYQQGAQTVTFKTDGLRWD